MKKHTFIFVAILLLVVGLTGAFASGAPEEQTWDLPQTGQRATYGSGSDGAYEKGIVWEDNARFSSVGTSVLIDDLTGLMWARSAVISPRSWAAAVDYANQSTYAGFDDWRLPNMREMRSLLHYGRDTAVWLKGVGFTELENAGYWTSTTYYYSTGSAWYVHLVEGVSYFASKSSSYHVLLVR